MSVDGVMMQILDLSRWAPSGDNTQPWRFEVLDESHVVVHGFDTRDHCVYDLNGRPSQISIGALLETMAIASSAHGLAMQATRRLSVPETTPTFDVRFEANVSVQVDPLIASITKRSVQRRPMSSRALTSEEKQALEDSVGPDYSIQWFECFPERFRTACLMFNNAKLRLTMPEAYLVHRSVIQWDARYSEDRVPDQALGIDPLTARLMQWVMKSWNRVVFFNTFLAGTWAPRIQMDFIPSLACGAHFVLKANGMPTTVDDFVTAGRAVQRFWLTATHLRLVQQPEMTPLIFASYSREGTRFTSSTKLLADAVKLELATRGLLGAGHECAVWMGRVGAGPPSASRSIRRPLNQLMLHGAPLPDLESSR
ncbi:MAG: molybdopterin biosynthesis protein MoeY [Burkholderiaceae bacterium]|nr:molybdopterin biosynthesis protein MoeY [Burkholderiaceae bacterium]